MVDVFFGVPAAPAPVFPFPWSSVDDRGGVVAVVVVVHSPEEEASEEEEKEDDDGVGGGSSRVGPRFAPSCVIRTDVRLDALSVPVWL